MRHAAVSTSPLQAYQSAFAQALRGGAIDSFLLPPARTRLYKTLIHNGVCAFIDACFPVCQAVLDKKIWRQLCSAFMREHRAQAPLFHYIALEFLTWLQSPERYRHRNEPPYLIHLAHYEYCELHIQTAPDIKHAQTKPNSARLITPIQLVCYPYPVHTIVNAQTAVPLTTTWLIIWRREDGRAGFAQINANIYALLELLAEHEDLARLYTHWTERCVPAADVDIFVQALQNLAQLGIIAVVAQ